MYKDYLNDTPIIGKLLQIVHYGKNVHNAFWGGGHLVFNDMYPLTTLNIVAHEASHGYTERYSNLKYENESGGMNEAYSDIAAEATEFYVNGKVDWLTGAAVMKNKEAMRHFEDPTKDGRSLGHYKDYSDGINVHFSSGIFNKAYYTLAHLSGWDPKKAFIPFGIANKLYWTKNSLMYQGACGAKKAAKDLKYSKADVVTAFEAVGITPCSPPLPPLPPADTVELVNKVAQVISGEHGTTKYYKITVPKGTNNLNFSLSDGDSSNENANIAIRKNLLPSSVSSYCRTFKSGNNNNCKFTVAKDMPGNWYVGVHGHTSYQNVKLLATHFEAPNVAPIVDFFWAPDKLKVKFTDSTTDSDGWLTKISWDFGDGSTAEGQHVVEHDYVNPFFDRHYGYVYLQYEH